ncbi:MAG: hypothetical protein HYY61_06095 [Deltaproteobacteria bacterium]|nr:hypothetical protein [Deltaproteobacteria bacterium]
MLFKTLSQKVCVLMCAVFIFFSYETFADSLEGRWKFCYHDGEWLYNADIFITKGATASYFVTRDKAKHIPTHSIIQESAIILKPGYEDMQALKQSGNYSSKDYIRLLGDLKFQDDKVIAVFEESVYGFSTKEYRLTLFPMGNHLMGSYDGRFVRPFKGEFEELYEHNFLGQEQWYKNPGKFMLCQE